jgi:uncharacterized protein YqjF (DUF2071 family)
MTLPLTMNGRLEECLLMSYRTPARTVRHLLPRGLELLTRDGFAFWSVVACRVEAMRPAGVPRPLGAGYRHVAYRLHVRARSAAGEALDGLYFVRSDADSSRVRRLGNLLTDFRFHRSDVELSHAKQGADDVITLAVQGRDDGSADALVRVTTQAPGAPPAAPAPDSLFTSAAEADQFLRYRPLGLSVDIDGRYLHLAQVVRDPSAWRERPVRVIEAHWKFFDALGQDDLHLERATRVDPIDYRWRLGRRIALAAPVAPVPTPHRPAAPARAAA